MFSVKERFGIFYLRLQSEMSLKLFKDVHVNVKKQRVAAGRRSEEQKELGR